MASAVCLDYFYGDEVKMDSFFRLPRVLLTSESCRSISAEVKYLYGLMLDRVSLSMRNGWREEGRVFIYFTLNDVKHLLNVGKNKAVRLFKQLETLGLICRRKQGQGKPARVFVRHFVEVPQEATEGATPELNCGATPEREAESTPAAPMPEPAPEASAKTTQPISTPVHDVKRPTPAAQEQRGQSATLPEAKDATPNGIARLLAECVVSVRRLGDILTQRLANGGVPAVNADSAAPAAPAARTEAGGKPVYKNYLRAYEGERWRNASLIREEIMENLDLSMITNEVTKEQICAYVDIMVQACCEQTPAVRINGSEYSRAMVRQRMYQLKATHLEYVYECMRDCAPKVRNLRAYILTALFNSYDTIGLYYDMKVEHDMAESYMDGE